MSSWYIGISVLPHMMGFSAFSHVMRIWLKKQWISYAKKHTWDGDLMGENYWYYGKVWLSISQTLPIGWVLLHIPMLWNIGGNTHHFPWCEVFHKIPWKHPYFGKIMGTNFLGSLMGFQLPRFSSSKMGIAAFFPAMGHSKTHAFPMWWRIQ